MKQTLVVIIDPVTPAKFGLKSLLEHSKYGYSVVNMYRDIPSFRKSSNNRADIILINLYAISFPAPFDVRELLPDNQSSMIVAMTNDSRIVPVSYSFDGTLNIYGDEHELAERLATLHKRFLSNANLTDPNPLTSREKAILMDIYNGLDNQQIADKLCVSVHTVRAHRRNIFVKTKIKCAAQFTTYVLKRNLIEFCAAAVSSYAALILFESSLICWV